MPKTDVYNMNGEVVGSIELDKQIFGVEVNRIVLHAAVVNYLANQRQGNQSTLTRGEVSGGGRKPWAQKGTGHARQGSTRSIQWTHGGVAFAPKPRDYSYALNKKTKRVAIRSALSDKLANGDIIVVSAIELSEIKTKSIINMLSALKVCGKAMILTDDVNEKVVLSSRNIEKLKTSFVGEINVYDILNSGKLLLTEAAVQKIQEVYAK